jgi:hypothetical protein
VERRTLRKVRALAGRSSGVVSLCEGASEKCDEGVIECERCEQKDGLLEVTVVTDFPLHVDRFFEHGLAGFLWYQVAHEFRCVPDLFRAQTDAVKPVFSSTGQAAGPDGVSQAPVQCRQPLGSPMGMGFFVVPFS